jgi:retron-type reverse transcriptase
VNIRATTGEEAFIEQLRDDLRNGRYQPSPSRRKLIPKPGKLGKFRPRVFRPCVTASYKAR